MNKVYDLSLNAGERSWKIGMDILMAILLHESARPR